MSSPVSSYRPIRGDYPFLWAWEAGQCPKRLIPWLHSPELLRSASRCSARSESQADPDEAASLSDTQASPSCPRGLRAGWGSLRTVPEGTADYRQSVS